MLGESINEKSFDELKCLKRELKAWESMFERKHSRKPNKDDVNNAPEEIKETYVKYRNLRKSNEMPLEIPRQEDKDDEVWGKSLNKSKVTGAVDTSVIIKMTPDDYKPIKLCHGQRPKKLFNNLSKSSMETDINSNELETNTVSNSVTVSDGKPASNTNIGDNHDLGFCITSKKSEMLTRPGMMLGKSKMNQKIKRRSTIARNWLEKNSPNLSDQPEQATPSDSSTMPEIHDSFAVVKTLKSISPDHSNCGHEFPLENSSPSCISENVMSRKHFENNFIQSQNICTMKAGGERLPDMDSSKNSSVKENTSNKTKDSIKQADDTLKDDIFDGNNDDQCTSLTPNINSQKKLSNDQRNSRKTSVKRVVQDSEDHSFDCTSDNQCSGTIKTSGDSTTSKANEETSGKLPDLDIDVFAFDQNESEDFPRDVSTAKRKRAVYEEKIENVPDEASKKRPKIVTTNSDHDEDENSDLDKSENQKSGMERSSSKRSSGLVSENFRALNLKVRRFSRGSSGTNYGAYKRKLWKQKQQEKEQGEKKPAFWKKKTTTSRTRMSATPATTTCFKCKQDGHWAKDCPRNKPQAKTASTNWSEPTKAPPDLEIGDEAWKATESKLEFLLTERLPRPHVTPCDAPPAIEPLYPAENGKPCSTPREVYKTLNKLGFDSFRPGQEEAIMQILCGLSTLVVLSTGAGKSLCYQLPAYMYSQRSPCLTLVISPLVSLMEDQVVGLPFGLCGVSLNTNMTKPQRQRAVDQIISGKAAVVLVSPEALVGGGIGPGCLPHVSKLPPIAFACIDEAHCVSEWSHNFRPSYLRVCRVLRERFGVRCFLGLTATATKSTALSVAEHLGITQRPDAIIRGATIPPNLNLSVSSDLNRDRAILELLQGSRFSDCNSIIIYCTRREQTDRVATYLRTCLQKNPLNTSSCITDQNDEEMEEGSKGKKRGRKKKSNRKSSSKSAASWQAECYHAGMTAAQRRKVQKMFMSGELRIVVATVAFGMGLDKANVRAIIHYNLPKSFESYVQEIGRAGRDGLPSHCHVFIDPEGKDVRELRRHAYASSVDRKMVKKLVSKIFPKCDCRTLEAKMKEKREKELGLREVKVNQSLGGTLCDNFDFIEDTDDQILDQVMEMEARIGTVSNEFDLSNCTEVKQEIPEATGENTERTDIPEATVDVAHVSEGVSGSTYNQTLEESSDVLEGSSSDAYEKYSRVCGGHEMALPIEKTVQTLDMKEESIETLLCYLELHEKKWVQILQPVRSTCTLKFYGGPAHLHFVAQRVPLVTAAVAYAREQKEFQRNTSSLTFPIVEIIDKMCWDLEPARRELYGLQWNEALSLPGESGLSAGHSGIIVEFSDFAFHVRAPGDLSDQERDEVCDFLEDRILAQERSQLSQLHSVWSTFNERAHPNCWQSSEECDKKVDEELKSIVKGYFESENDPTKAQLITLSEARKKCQFVKSSIPDANEPVNWDSVSRDIRSFLNLHADAELSGRAIARIFHGIDSPCFPAATWGRDRRFWRRHLDVDFNQLRKFAIKELVRFK